MSESIYRFTSFDSFVDIVQRKSLPLVNFESWEDPYEGFLFRVVKQENGAKKIFDILKRKYPDLAMVFWGILTQFSSTIYGQSWSLRSESDALWRIYSHGNKSLRIKVEKEKVRKIDGITLNN